MDDFQTICIYMKTYLFLRISLKDGCIFLVSLKKFNIPNIIPRAKHVLNTFKLRTLYAHLYLFIVYILFALVIMTSIHRSVNTSHDIKVLMKVIKTETFNIGFTSQ